MEIVAEFTYNHFGNIDRARKMVDAAKKSGATAVKFEIRNSDNYFRNNPEIKSRKKQYEFSDEQINQFVKHCENVGISWFASVHDVDSLKRIFAFNPKYIKVASREARNENFISKITELTNNAYPLIISTGALSFIQIKKIYEVLKIDDLTLVHTSCFYPCEVENLNMNRIKLMKDTLNCNIGYSGHEQGFLPSLYAVSLGINYLERHFTLEESPNNVAKGMNHFNDDLCTLSPYRFKEMTDAIKVIVQIRSQAIIMDISPGELERVNVYGQVDWDGDIFLKPL